MESSQKLAMVALTSTSLVVTVCYWLLAFLKFYFEFQEGDSLLTDLSQNCPLTSGKYYILVRFSMTQWITIIIASLCIIIELGILITICFHSKNKEASYLQNEMEFEGKREASDEATHSYINDEHNTFRFETSQLTQRKLSSKQMNKINYIFIFILILFMGFGTNFGHAIQAAINLNEEYGCIKQKQALERLIENYFVLAALLAYSFISATIRMILVPVFYQRTYPRKGANHPKCFHSIAIQTQRNQQRGQGESTGNINNINQQQGKNSMIDDSSNFDKSRVDGSGVFHMPKLKLGSYYEGSGRKL